MAPPRAQAAGELRLRGSVAESLAYAVGQPVYVRRSASTRWAYHPVTAAPLALTVRPERAALTGDRARVMRQLKGGRRSRLRFSHNYEADRKQLQRERAGTLSCTGRSERLEPTLGH